MFFSAPFVSDGGKVSAVTFNQSTCVFFTSPCLCKMPVSVDGAVLRIGELALSCRFLAKLFFLF